ncbi:MULTISPECIES: hypothetical protein [Cysteiniphilum]|uniref:Uncharacterized protein n=1 Tax=Cysteiniphilum litorale TaxID=2056700 RepID=A0A8J3EA58_9GAMM|nr:MULTISPECIES: hypothetical protein [Cysteiniphilum]GGG04001.1 hypothetical protein GCM10010995_21860 [Cysteiniphilum litorale]
MGLSLRKAINDKCKDCIYDPLDNGAGTWRQQVEACKCKNCPIWKVRPLSSTKINSKVVNDANTGHLTDKSTLTPPNTLENILRG